VIAETDESTAAERITIEDGELFPYGLADDFVAMADAYDEVP
jgi:hypothetical protein